MITKAMIGVRRFARLFARWNYMLQSEKGMNEQIKLRSILLMAEKNGVCLK